MSGNNLFSRIKEWVSPQDVPAAPTPESETSPADRDQAVLTALSRLIDRSIAWVDRIDWGTLKGAFYTTDSDNRINHLLINGMGMEDITLVGKLDALEGLALIDNGIKHIEPLAGLTRLVQLILDRNQIVDITPLAGLKSLTRLSMERNLIKVSQPLASLTDLIELNLGQNRLAACDGLENCHGLLYLVLKRNQISDLTPLNQLTALSHLDLEKNQVADLTPLEGLTGLSELNLAENQVGDLTPLASLKQLETLSLRHNQITELAPLSGLLDVGYLDLEGNQIENAAALTGLSNPRMIDLSHNRLKTLPLALFQQFERYSIDGTKTHLNLTGNKLTYPPPEILSRGRSHVLTYLEALDQKEQPVAQAKVLLVGDGYAGKTSLVKRIVEQSYKPDQDQTQGVDIHEWNHVCADGLEMRINFWDFGGQEILHATHQFFLTQRSLYVVVQSARDVDKLNFWLQHVATFGGNSPVLVVINKIDEHPGFQCDENQLKRDFPNIIDFLRVSCKTEDGLEDFISCLANSLESLEMARSSWPMSWFHVKQELERMEAPYIYLSSFHDICRAHGVAHEEGQEILLGHLHDLGVMLSFPEMEPHATKVLNPRWVTDGVYQVITAPALAHAHGRLQLEQLNDILDDNEYPPDCHRFLVELMRQFELCYPLEEADTYLVPNLLKAMSPNQQELNEEIKGTRLRYMIHFPEFLPGSVFLSAMVRLHRHIRTSWRRGMILDDKNGTRALLVEDTANQVIRISVAGERRHQYFAVIHFWLRKICEAFKSGLVVNDHLPISKSDRVSEALRVSYILSHERMGETTLLDNNGSQHTVSDLLASIRRPAFNGEEVMVEMRHILPGIAQHHPEGNAYIPTVLADVVDYYLLMRPKTHELGLKREQIISRFEQTGKPKTTPDPREEAKLSTRAPGPTLLQFGQTLSSKPPTQESEP